MLGLASMGVVVPGVDRRMPSGEDSHCGRYDDVLGADASSLTCTECVASLSNQHIYRPGIYMIGTRGWSGAVIPADMQIYSINDQKHRPVWDSHHGFW